MIFSSFLEVNETEYRPNERSKQNDIDYTNDNDDDNDNKQPDMPKGKKICCCNLAGPKHPTNWYLNKKKLISFGDLFCHRKKRTISKNENEKR